MVEDACRVNIDGAYFLVMDVLVENVAVEDVENVEDVEEAVAYLLLAAVVVLALAVSSVSLAPLPPLAVAKLSFN